MKVCSFCHRCYEDAAVCCVDEDHPLLSETREGDPEMVAGFGIEKLIGSNTRGETYSARQTECGRACLIKILPANEAKRENFLSEAKVAAAIFDRNVADIYDSGVLETGELFVVAEDTESQTLRERLDTDVPVDLLTAIRIIRQAAEAVHALHLKGLTHGAVRPENIVLIHGAESLAKVQNPDFGGLAQHAIISNKFLIDSAVDSLRYFAPEQCTGDDASPQTDVYSLGIVFYEMLAGRPPFDADKAAALIEKHRTQPPPDVKINSFELRMLVMHTLMESLQKQPRFRQSSANAFARQLRHIEQLATHMATPPPAGIVPPAPTRSAPRVSVAIDSATSTSIAPSVMIESAAARTKNSPIIAAHSEEKSVQVIVMDSDPSTVVERQFNELRADIGEHLSVEPVVENVVETKAIAANPVETKTIISAPKRSRMKLHRKLSQMRPAAQDKPDAPPMPVVERALPAEAEIEEMRVESPSIAIDEVIAINVEPTRVEWEQAEDDIPSVEDVMKVLRLEKVAETPAFEADEVVVAERPTPDEKPFIAETLDAAVITRPEPAAVLKGFQPVVEQPEVRFERKPSREIVDVIRSLRKAQPESNPADVEEQEEITLVRTVGSQIRIDLDKPMPWKKWSRGDEQSAFVPTLLGDGKHGAIDPDVRDSMFADYYDKPRLRFVTGRRLAAIGAPLALIVMFLFGNDLVTKYLQARSSDESAAVKTAETPESSPPVSRTKSAKKPVRRSIKRVGSENETSAPLRTAVTRNNEKPAAARTAPTAKPEARRTEAKPTINSAKPAGSTRPRIVQNPKH